MSEWWSGVSNVDIDVECLLSCFRDNGGGDRELGYADLGLEFGAWALGVGVGRGLAAGL